VPTTTQRTRPSIRQRAGIVALLLARLAIGGIFFHTGLTKLTDIDAFARAVANYAILPTGTEGVFALLLAAAEVVFGAALCVGIRPRLAALGIAAMEVVFIVAMTIVWANGTATDCGCGFLDEEVGPTAILRDAALLVVTLCAAYAPWAGLGNGDLARCLRRQ